MFRRSVGTPMSHRLTSKSSHTTTLIRALRALSRHVRDGTRRRVVLCRSRNAETRAITTSIWSKDVMLDAMDTGDPPAVSSVISRIFAS